MSPLAAPAREVMPCEAYTANGEICWRATRDPSRRCGKHGARRVNARASITPSTSQLEQAAILARALDGRFGVQFSTNGRVGNTPVVEWVDGPAAVEVLPVVRAAFAAPLIVDRGCLVDPAGEQGTGRVVCFLVRGHSPVTLCAALLAHTKADPPAGTQWAKRIAASVLQHLATTSDPDAVFPATAAARRLAEDVAPSRLPPDTAWLIDRARSLEMPRQGL